MSKRPSINSYSKLFEHNKRYYLSMNLYYRKPRRFPLYSGAVKVRLFKINPFARVTFGSITLKVHIRCF